MVKDRMSPGTLIALIINYLTRNDERIRKVKIHFLNCINVRQL